MLQERLVWCSELHYDIVPSCPVLPSLHANHSFSYYRLKPQEEDLLAAVLTREEQTLELDNPFDPHRTCLDELPDGAAAPGADQSSPQQPLDMQNAVAPGPAPHPQAVVAAAEQADAGSETDVAAPAGPGQAGTEGAAACSSVASVQSGPISRASSCLSSSVFSMMMRPSSSGLKGQRCSLADIDARLEAIKAEKEGARQLPTAAAGRPHTVPGMSCKSMCRLSHVPGQTFCTGAISNVRCNRQTALLLLGNCGSIVYICSLARALVAVAAALTIHCRH